MERMANGSSQNAWLHSLSLLHNIQDRKRRHFDSSLSLLSATNSKQFPRRLMNCNGMLLSHLGWRITTPLLTVTNNSADSEILQSHYWSQQSSFKLPLKRKLHQFCSVRYAKIYSVRQMSLLLSKTEVASRRFRLLLSGITVFINRIQTDVDQEIFPTRWTVIAK